MMNGRRLQIGTVSVSASPWVGTQSSCVSYSKGPLETEAVEGCQPSSTCFLGVGLEFLHRDASRA